MLRQIIKPDEGRPLALRVERIDPKFLLDGQPPPAKARVDPERPSEKPQFRHYRIEGLPWPVRVQLNSCLPAGMGRDPAEDAERLRDVAESLLAPRLEPMDLPVR